MPHDLTVHRRPKSNGIRQYPTRNIPPNDISNFPGGNHSAAPIMPPPSSTATHEAPSGPSMRDQCSITHAVVRGRAAGSGVKNDHIGSSLNARASIRAVSPYQSGRSGTISISASTHTLTKTHQSLQLPSFAPVGPGSQPFYVPYVPYVLSLQFLSHLTCLRA